MKITVDWFGDDLKDASQRAQMQAMAEAGEMCVALAKDYAHKETGTLARSIHTAPVGYTADELDAAKTADLGDMFTGSVPEWTDEGASMCIGSWIPYAVVEEIYRGHAFLQPAKEAMQAAFPELLRKYFAEEGFGS